MRPAKITAGAARMRGISPDKGCGLRRKQEGPSGPPDVAPNPLISPEIPRAWRACGGPARRVAATASPGRARRRGLQQRFRFGHSSAPAAGRATPPPLRAHGRDASTPLIRRKSVSVKRPGKNPARNRAPGGAAAYLNRAIYDAACLPPSQPPRRSSRHWIANQPYLLLCITALCWAGNAIVGRLAAGHIPPVTLSFLRWGSRSCSSFPLHGNI